MKLSLSREQLLSPLQSVIGAVERKQTMPTLECVLLEAEGDSFTLTATNLEMQMRATMELPAKEGGFCVHARKLFDILRALPDKATIELNHADSRLVIKSGKSRFQLATLPAGNFPVFAIDGDSVEFSVESADLRRALEKAASAQARDDVRYYLNGVCLRLAGAQMRAIASDGHRLAYCDIALSEAVEVTQEFILPRRSVLELLKLLPGDEQILTCHLHSRTFMVDLPGLSFSTKLLEGKFPDENRVIPRDFDAEFAIDRDTLSSLVGRAAILADEKIPLIRLELQGGLLNVTGSNAEAEEARDELAVDCAAAFEAGFNARYLGEALNQIDSKAVRLRLDEKQVTLLQDAESDAYGLIVMPVRL